MTFRKPSKRLVLVTILPITLVAALGAFYARSALTPGSGSEDRNSRPSSDVGFSPGSSLTTPEPGETPDPTKPGWFLKWDHQDGMRERRDIVVNGFSIGPNVEPQQGIPCDEEDTPAYVDFDLARSSRVAIEPSYLPFDLSMQDGTAVSCGGEVVLTAVLLDLPQIGSDAALIDRVKAGENYFDLPRGGSLEILRVVADPAWSSSIPPERWDSGTIAGFPAAIGRPVIDDGYGNSEILVHAEGILTLVRGNNLSLQDMIKVAEGLFR